MPIGRRAAIRTCLLAAGLGGCTGFGPDTMRYQQADYASALADAGKRQTLLNIVKLRYGDVPAFVTSTRSLPATRCRERSASGPISSAAAASASSDDANIGVGGTFTNNPTVTYAPVTGADFARTFLAPMQPADLFGLILAGVPPELVLGLGLHSIGGYDNERGIARRALAAADSEFHRGARIAPRDASGGQARRSSWRFAARTALHRSRIGSGDGGGCARKPPSPRCSSCRRPRHLRGSLYAVHGRSPARSRSVPAR